MDTKSLHDWANDAGINMRDSEGYYDAQAVWVDAIMQSPEHLMDFWSDWMYDDQESIVRMLTYMGKADSDLMDISTKPSFRNNDCLVHPYANGAMMSSSCAGEELRRTIRKGLTAYTEEMAEEWWADVQGYAGDMEEGAREDYEYARYKDRQLEERS